MSRRAASKSFNEYNRIQVASNEKRGRGLSIKPHLISPLFYQIVISPRCTRFSESILGKGVMLWSSEFFVKKANIGRYVGWHQDAPLFPLKGDVVAIWMAVTLSSIESGAMQVFSGSHRSPPQTYEMTGDDKNILRGGLELDKWQPRSDPVSLVLKPGEASIHHGHLVHGGGANNSSQDRIGFVMRYISSRTTPTSGIDSATPITAASDAFIMEKAPADFFSPSALSELGKALALPGGRGDQIIE